MRRLLIAASVLACCLPSAAGDRIYKRGEAKPIECTVEKEDWKEVTYKLQGAASGTLSWDKVASIDYGDEPVALKDARAAAEKGDREGAAELYRKAADGLAEKPIHRARALFNAGTQFQTLGKYGEAIAAFDALLKEIPSNRYFKEASEARVACFLSKGDSKGATDAITASVAQAKEMNVDAQFSAMMNLKEAEVLEAAGDIATANGKFGAVSGQASGKWPAIAGMAKLGQARCQMKSSPAVAQGTFESITKDPSFKTQRAVIGAAYAGLGDCLFEQAEKGNDLDKMKRAAISYLNTVTLYFPPDSAPTGAYESALVGGARAFLVLAQKAEPAAKKARETWANQSRSLAVMLIDQFPSSVHKTKAEEIRKAADAELEKAK
ncbi:MAG: hypothetical protein HUU15_01455 [Candidatus Brocadiae bacterium]|nr:hypothetical protein [Candidatus Brocadiia bacterium]